MSSSNYQLYSPNHFISKNSPEGMPNWVSNLQYLFYFLLHLAVNQSTFPNRIYKTAWADLKKETKVPPPSFLINTYCCMTYFNTILTAYFEMREKKKQQWITWFFPFSIRMLVTLPKGKPKAITSVSVTSPGSFLIWRTREGDPSILSSLLNFLLSLPLAERHIKTIWRVYCHF